MSLAHERALSLAQCSMQPGSWDKRFVRSMVRHAQCSIPLSEKQAANLERLAWKYRRQMPARLVPDADPARK